MTDTASVDGTMDLDAGLVRLGYERFRAGQRDSIELLLRARRLLLVAPTGDGKSLTYQLPASGLPGTTLGSGSCFRYACSWAGVCVR